jgi:hypothetical protein
MVKKEVDYSNTVIYKIVCKDESIKDLYVGHTTNFDNRKYQHKLACNNNKLNKCKIYKIINENGGWDNWEMIEIEKVNCQNLLEARQKENEHYNLLNATLNSIPPYSETIQYCNLCNKNYNKLEYKTHINTLKHLKNSQNIINTNENNKFNCKICNFYCSKKSNYNTHCSTQKHINAFKDLQNNGCMFSCNICGNTYNHRQSLYKHKKTCNPIIKEDNTPILNTNLKTELLEQNTKFKELILKHSDNISSYNNDILQSILDQTTTTIKLFNLLKY